MPRPKSMIASVANLFSKMMTFEAVGDREEGHCHQFDHLTLLAHGQLEVVVDGNAKVFTAPHMIYIKANKQHQLTALQAGTVAYCIHALRGSDQVGDILDPDMIPAGVDAMLDGFAQPLTKG